jgi:hypothetical protein
MADQSVEIFSQEEIGAFVGDRKDTDIPTPE